MEGGEADPRVERDAMREFVRREALRRNEEIARRVNEQTADDADRGALGSGLEFLCECGSASCMERLPMSVDEFQSVHSTELRFAVLPGHELPDVERVIELTARYMVVEKLAS